MEDLTKQHLRYLKLEVPCYTRHHPYSAQCKVCVESAGRRSHHRKSRQDEKDRRVGSACFDLVALGKTRAEAQIIVMVQKTRHAQIYVTAETKTKSETDLKQGIYSCFHQLAYLHRSPAIQRIHSDKESSGMPLKKSLEETGICYTVTQGGDPTSTAENAVGLITRGARSKLAHLSCRNTKKKLWSYAAAHHAMQVTVKNWKTGRITDSCFLPFGSACKVLSTSTVSTRFDDKLDRPCPSW